MKSIPSELLFRKNDPMDLRWGDRCQINEDDKNLAKTLTSDKNWIQMMGYPDDEGIVLNGGRPGASLAPLVIRKDLFKTTLTASQKKSQQWLCDHGDLDPHPLYGYGDIGSRHEMARKLVAKYLHHGPLVTLGGGHDYGYSDACGFMDYFSSLKHSNQITNSQRPLVINFDAHLDVRSTEKGFNSGTPFYRFLNEFKGKVDFIEIGIQSQCNSPDHFKWCQDQGAKIISMEEIKSVGLLPLLKQALVLSSKKQDCFISFDIDAFAQALAPGCSQAWDTGLEIQETFQALNWLFLNKKVRQLSIYEVSPPLDIDKRTSKLAASIIHTYIESLSN